MQAVITAAGKGTRLRPLTHSVPKPLAVVDYREGTTETMMERLVRQIKTADVTDIVLVVNHGRDVIERYVSDGSPFGINVEYVVQEELDGNAGALFRCRDCVTDDFIVTDCDNFIGNDEIFRDMRELFEETGADAVVGVSEVDDISRFAIFKTDEEGNVIDIREKPTDRGEWGNLAKSGIAVMSQDVIHLDKEMSRAPGGEYTTTQLFKHMMERGMEIVPYMIDSEYEDVGTWESYHRIVSGTSTQSNSSL